ncbi:MAG: HprK-related kinase A [Gammaproteobacteria bacterium]|nr:MAG: HprK-related kinase A [Gammaproteobacteria bacterium]
MVERRDPSLRSTVTQTVASLTRRELRARLSREGLQLVIPPVTARITSSIDTVLEGIQILYAPYQVSDHPFADFHVHLRASQGVRRLVGRQVIFDFDGMRPFSPHPLGQAFPVFEWALNWCITNHLHEYLIVHGAVVEKEGKALLMPGVPGAGKSTLAAALMLTGWRLLSDEHILLRSDGLIQPAPRPVSLKNQSIELIRGRWPDAHIGRVVHDTRKGSIVHLCADDESITRADSAPSPALLVFPRYEATLPLPLEMDQIGRADALIRLHEHCFNFHILREEGFNRLTRLVGECECFDLRYRDLDQALEWLEHQLAASSR